MARVTPNNLNFFGALDNAMKNIFQSAVEMKKQKFLMGIEKDGSVNLDKSMLHQEELTKKAKQDYDFWDKNTTDRAIEIHKMAKDLRMQGLLSDEEYKNLSDPLTIKKNIMTNVDAIESEMQKMIQTQLAQKRLEDVLSKDPEADISLKQIKEMDNEQYLKYTSSLALKKKLREGNEITQQDLLSSLQNKTIKAETFIKLSNMLADGKAITENDFYDRKPVTEMKIDLNKDYTQAKSEEVKSLQQKLIDAGYSVGAKGVDGVFGDDTQAALADYMTEEQKSYLGGKEKPVTKAELTIMNKTNLDKLKAKIKKDITNSFVDNDLNKTIVNLSKLKAEYVNEKGVGEEIDKIIKNVKDLGKTQPTAFETAKQTLTLEQMQENIKLTKAKLQKELNGKDSSAVNFFAQIGDKIIKNPDEAISEFIIELEKESSKQPFTWNAKGLNPNTIKEYLKSLNEIIKQKKSEYPEESQIISSYFDEIINDTNPFSDAKIKANTEVLVKRLKAVREQKKMSEKAGIIPVINNSNDSKNKLPLSNYKRN